MSLLKEITSKIPAPLAGLGLGVAGLSAATVRVYPVFGKSLEWLTGLILLIFLCKIVFNFKAFRADLNHPVFSSILPTFSMSLMIFATFIARVDCSVGKVVWFLAIILHVALLASFVVVTVRARSFSNIVPSYLIPSVGLVVACVTGKNFQALELCNAIFYVGAISCVPLLIFVFWRLLSAPLPDAKRGTLVILAAPSNLCVAGYFSMQQPPSLIFLYIFIPVSFVLTLWAYSLVIRFFRAPFNPGWSAFTFPLVISSVATTKLGGFMEAKGFSGFGMVQQLGRVELYVAIAVVLVVLAGYLRFFLLPKK